MGTIGEALAAQFEQANEAVIAAVEALTDEQWAARTAAEGWSVGVAAHHIAASHAAIAGFTRLVATGQAPPPLTPEMFDQINAQHAREHTACSIAETLELLRSGGAGAAAVVRTLTDEQLACTAPVLGRETSAAQVIEQILIGHPRQHLASIQAVI